MLNKSGWLGFSSNHRWQGLSEAALTSASFSEVSVSSSDTALADTLWTKNSFRASAVRSQLTVDPGNTLSSALDLGALGTTPITLTDSVNRATDPNDYFRFTLGAAGSFSLTLTGMQADADVQLLNATGGVIRSSVRGGTQNEAISLNLVSGTYYVRVYPYSGSTNYTLTLTATTNPSPVTGFNQSYGYGLVNAAAAVAQAIGQPTFADVPNLGGNYWGVDRVNAPEVWARGYTGQGIVVAVVDSGVDYTHPDLDANIWVNTREIAGNGIDDDGNGFIDDIRGWDFIDRDNNPFDLDGHGTHVAGTIAAENNEFGALGIAYNARIMPVRVLDANGSGSTAGVAAGVRYAADNGARVINLSLGGGFSSELQAAIQYATQRGSIVVMASGNEARNQPSYPAQFASQNGIAVGAIDINNGVANFSNKAGVSPLSFVVAPGVNIYSTTPNNTYQNFNGTSMATPHVAGVVALMLSANSGLTPAQVVSILNTTANPAGITG